MRQKQTLSPTAWLAGGPIVIGSPAQVLQSFAGGTVQVIRFVGPHRLFRAVGWRVQGVLAAEALGSWWVDEATLARLGELMAHSAEAPGAAARTDPTGELGPGHHWSAVQHGAAALCEDFSDQQPLYMLDLPRREELTGVIGLAATVPAASRQHALPEGIEQVYFKRSRTLDAVNPRWVRRCDW